MPLPRLDTLTDAERRGAQLALAHIKARAGAMTANLARGRGFSPAERRALKLQADALRAAANGMRADLLAPLPVHLWPEEGR